VNYESHGRGKEAIVLIHGWACDLTFWKQHTPELSKKARVIALDLPGHGLSDRPEVAYTQRYFAEAVYAVLKDAGVSKALLVGHSMGAPIARLVIADHPDIAVGIILVDAAVWPSSPEDIERRKQRTRPLIAGLLKQYVQTAGPFIDPMFVPSTPQALRDEIKFKMLGTPAHVAASAMEDFITSDVWTLPQCDLPALALLAKREGRPLERETQLLQKVFPKAEVQTWEGVGHFLHMEQPQKFNAAVLQFWERVRK
jgi:pimeloyl-ACP methyl ester carboxylesterase